MQKVVTWLLFTTTCWAQHSVDPAVTPEWQRLAGDKMAFEVASVKPLIYPSYRSAFSLDTGNSYRFTGGRFSAAFPLYGYILLSYKMERTERK